jgi:hypothetical protein
MQLIPFAALALWPLYAIASRRLANRRLIRQLLLLFFALQAVPSLLVARLWFGGDIGRFDDGMIGLVLLGFLTIPCSLFVIAAGEFRLWRARARRKEDSAQASLGA